MLSEFSTERTVQKIIINKINKYHHKNLPLSVPVSHTETVLFDSKLGFSRILDSLYKLRHIYVHAFAILAIAPPKVNRFGWNLEHSWVHCRKLVLADFGRDLYIKNTRRARWNFVFCFCQVSKARFHRFPVGQISWNLNTTHQSLSQWKLS